MYGRLSEISSFQRYKYVAISYLSRLSSSDKFLGHTVHRVMPWIVPNKNPLQSVFLQSRDGFNKSLGS